MASTPPIRNKKKFLAYNEIERGMFTALRLGVLSLMPIIDESGNYEDAAIDQCETFASTVVDNWPEELKRQQTQYTLVNGKLVASTSINSAINSAIKTT